ncbi:sce7726 family protein [uncultured Leifsonia sp.]|uniref:sce7726 family protein n=1 Tax=uncultured Leifsonia sp. TaxID=340359 RepID=UPI0034379F6E
MNPVTEREIRSLVRSIVAPEPRPLGTKLVEEFVIGDAGRIDIALIGDHLAGFELKSDFDSLARLPRQMEVYGGVFDFCTLVVTDRHLARARAILRPGWGLAVVRRNKDVPDSLEYKQFRTPRPIRTVHKEALVSLLWRDELVRALDRLHAADGFRSKQRDVLEKRLCSVSDLAQLKSIVTDFLTARQGWRDVQAQHVYDEKSRRAGVSSGFLARRLQSQRQQFAGRLG